MTTKELGGAIAAPERGQPEPAAPTATGRPLDARQERARRAYQESRIRGADPQQLLALLYDGLLQNLHAGQRALRERDWEAAQASLSKARRIVTYLSNSLRPEGGEITERLRPLYAFCFENIGRASLEQRPELLDGVVGVVGQLSGAWTALASGRRDAAGTSPGGEA